MPVISSWVRGKTLFGWRDLWRIESPRFRPPSSDSEFCSHAAQRRRGKSNWTHGASPAVQRGTITSHPPLYPALSLLLVLIFLPAWETLGFARRGRPLSLEYLHQDECTERIFSGCFPQVSKKREGVSYFVIDEDSSSAPARCVSLKCHPHQLTLSTCSH